MGSLDLSVVGMCLDMKYIQDPPSSQAVVELCDTKGIRRVRLYEANGDMLKALGGSSIEVMLGIPNDSIEPLSTEPTLANKWVTDNIIKYTSVQFKYIVVGNEVDLASKGSALQNALENIFKALSNNGLETQINVTTAVGHELLSDQSFSPPSQAVFKDNVAWSMGNILKFLNERGYPLLVNVHPFKSYAATPNPDIQFLNFALFEPSTHVIVDKDRVYHNLFDAMLASLHAAVEKASTDTPFNQGFVISETGWPTAGLGTATSGTNANTFNSNIIKKIKNGFSTPVFVNSLYDEKLTSTNNEWDKNWGLFEPDGTPKY